MYNEFKSNSYDPKKIEKAITELIKFEDDIKLKGIYEFILKGEAKYLSVRKFPDNIKMKVCLETLGLEDFLQQLVVL